MLIENWQQRFSLPVLVGYHFRRSKTGNGPSPMVMMMDSVIVATAARGPWQKHPSLNHTQTQTSLNNTINGEHPRTTGSTWTFTSLSPSNRRLPPIPLLFTQHIHTHRVRLRDRRLGRWEENGDVGDQGLVWSTGESPQTPVPSPKRSFLLRNASSVNNNTEWKCLQFLFSNHILIKVLPDKDRISIIESILY